MRRRTVVFAAALAAALAATPSRAQTVGDDVADTMRTTAAEAGQAWTGLVNIAGRAFDIAAAWWPPREPSDDLPDRLPEEDRAFVALMDMAGYRIAGIDVAGGLLPAGSTYHFLQERMPSAADLERVRTGLAAHRSRFSGPTATRHRRILGAILDMASHADYRISSIDIERGWWPDTRFHVTATGRPLTESERRLLEAARGSGSGPARP